MRQEIRVEACTGAAIDVRAGQTLTVVDLCGGQVGDFFAQAAGNPGEFLSPGVTIDCNESLALRVGDTIYTNLYRPMFLLLRDDAGQNDLIHPSCRKEMFDFFYHDGEGHPNCLDNLNGALGTNHPILQPVNLFMNTRILPDGRIVNIDGFGNRLAATLYGPKKVYMIVGENKLADTLDAAMDRIKNVSCPRNAKRLNLKTPCAVLGRCTDCSSPDRMCHATLILDRKPNAHPMEILLVAQELGY